MTAYVYAEIDEDDQDLWRWTPLRKIRVPVDVVAPEHETVHDLALRWGAWNRQHSARNDSSFASIADTYVKGDTPPSTAPLETDPEIMVMELAVIRMLLRDVTRQHGETIRMIYVRRFSAFTISRAFRLRYEDYQRWTWTAREIARCAMMVGRYGA